MFGLRIQMTHGDALNFQYKSAETAQAQYDLLAQNYVRCTIIDDYKRRAWIRGENIISILLSDLSQETECSIDLAILQAEMNVKAQNRAQTSPLLRQGPLTGPASGRRQ